MKYLSLSPQLEILSKYEVHYGNIITNLGHHERNKHKNLKTAVTNYIG